MPLKKESVLQYAKSIPVNEKAVRRAIEEGKIVKGYDAKNKKIITAYADKEWGDLKREEAAVRVDKRGESVKPKVKSGDRLANGDKEKKESKKAFIESDDFYEKLEENFDFFDEKKGKNPKKKQRNADDPPSVLGDDDYDEDDFPELDELTLAEISKTIKVDSRLPLREAVRRKEVVDLALQKLKLQELERVVVRRDEVNKKLSVLGNELRMQLQSIPPRVVSDIMSADSEADGINLLMSAINDVLERASELVVE